MVRHRVRTMPIGDEEDEKRQFLPRKDESDDDDIFLGLLWVVIATFLILLLLGIASRLEVDEMIEREAFDADTEMWFRIGNDTAINATLNNETLDRQNGDQALNDRIDNVLDVSLGKIRTINGVRSNSTTADMHLIVNGSGGLSIFNDDSSRSITLSDDGISDVLTAANSGLTATKDGMTNVVEVDSGAVLSVEGQEPNGVSKNIDVTGTGGITVTTMGAATNEVIIDGSTLETAVNNLNMENQQQSMRLDDQEDVDEDLQMQIDALELSGQMIAQALNGTVITFNMSLMELMSTVYMLKAQVAALEAAPEPEGVPIGTMIPYGGEIAPSGYLKCDGTKYPIANYSDLYSVIGDTYCLGISPCAMGEFAVPDMRGRAAIGMDNGSPNFGTTGQQSGSETVTLMTTQIPSHVHSTGSAGSHSHTEGSAGSHTHGMFAAGSHDHGGTSSSSVPHTHGTGSLSSGSTDQGTAESTSIQPNVIYDGNFADTYVTCLEQSNRETCNTAGPITSRSVMVVTVNNQNRGGDFQWNGGTGAATSTSHTHNVPSDGGHTHGIISSGSHTHTINSAGAHTHSISATGGGEAHPNVQPSLAVGLYAIKY